MNNIAVDLMNKAAGGSLIVGDNLFAHFCPDEITIGKKEWAVFQIGRAHV